MTVALLMLDSVILFVIWASRFQIVLYDSIISYRTLFAGTRSLASSEIEKSDIQIGLPDRYWDRICSLGFYRLVVTPYPSAGKRTIIINMKIFNDQDIAHVIDFLKPMRRKVEEKENSVKE